MTDRGAAERACKDPNPIIDGRKANVNLAYLGAKPRSLQTGEIQRGCAELRLARKYRGGEYCVFADSDEY